MHWAPEVPLALDSDSRALAAAVVARREERGEDDMVRPHLRRWLVGFQQPPNRDLRHRQPTEAEDRGDTSRHGEVEEVVAAEVVADYY